MEAWVNNLKVVYKDVDHFDTFGYHHPPGGHALVIPWIYFKDGTKMQVVCTDPLIGRDDDCNKVLIKSEKDYIRDLIKKHKL